MMIRFLFPILFLLISITAYSQTTGFFDLSITFDKPDYSATRTLYYFVPSDYDPNKTYKLVVGFRGGPHSDAGQFRIHLTPLADSLDAIIMCPENIAHFNTQENLTKQLFQYAVDTTLSMYNIDPDFIYLTGLSFGGRHAVIVSMNTTNGPIPKLRGVIPFAAGRESENQATFSQAQNFPPACICIGQNDMQVFRDVSTALYNGIITNNGNAFLNLIPNVGHTTAFLDFPSEMMECINYIEQQYINTSSTNLNKTQADIQLSPNPTVTTLQINYPIGFQPIEVILMDASGKIVRQFLPSQNQLNLNGIQKGLYFLSIKSEKGVISKKVIKMD